MLNNVAHALGEQSGTTDKGPGCFADCVMPLGNEIISLELCICSMPYPVHLCPLVFNRLVLWKFSDIVNNSKLYISYSKTSKDFCMWCMTSVGRRL